MQYQLYLHFRRDFLIFSNVRISIFAMFKEKVIFHIDAYVVTYLFCR